MMSKIISAILAVGFSFLLFVAMTILIEPTALAMPEAKSVPPISFTYEDIDEPPGVRKYPLPTPPKKPEKPQVVRTKATTDSDTDRVATIKYDRPTRNGVKFRPTLKNLMGAGSGSSPGPSVRINPRYPRDAAINGIEGRVTLSFDISELGTTENISVVEAIPRGVFNKAAIKALRKWKYSVKIENEQAMKQPGQLITLEFKLESDLY